MDNAYHTDFAYHSDICRSVYIFHTILFTPVATHGHSLSIRDGWKASLPSSFMFVRTFGDEQAQSCNERKIEN
jgi:hypothetical protein